MNIFSSGQQLEINAHISRYGYVIVNVVSAKRASILLKQLQHFVKCMGTSIYFNKGIIKSHGIGQSDVMWKIRRVRTIKKVFATLCNCNPIHLLPSFDADNINKNVTVLWPHRDQRPSNNKIDIHFKDYACLKAMVALYVGKSRI